MPRTTRLLAALSALPIILAGCPAGGGGQGGPATGPAGTDGAPGAGTTITVTSLWGGSEQESFQEVLDAFQEATGITAEYQGERTEYAQVLQTRIQGGDPPDVAIMPGIGFLRSFARAGQLVPLSELGIDRAAIEDNYAPGILDIGTVDGDLYGIMVKFNSKSTIWYRPTTFEDQGLETPGSWDDLLAVTDSLRGAGLTPWAVGAGGGDSWTLTDWFESIYIRQAGPEAYDTLFSAEGNWTDPSVVDAIETMTEIINEENVAGGIEGALATGFVDGIGLVFGTDPTAELYYEGGFVGGLATGQVNPDLELGTDIDWFDFPPISEEHGNPVTIGGDVIAAVTDNPGVREFIEFMTTAEAGETWAGTGAVISPVRDVDAGVYPNEQAQREARQVTDAEAVRFDGSDLLPAGTDLGAVLQGAIQGQDVAGLLADFQSTVENAWAEETGG